jgi:signal transduction histidine kinase
MADRDDARVNRLQRRLRVAIERLERLRRDASDMAAELRNRLHTVTMQREALRTHWRARNASIASR